MAIVFSTMFFLYACIIILLIKGLLKARGLADQVLPPLSERTMVSIIIAARNEKGIIEQLLADLGQQDYLSFEVIVVDDHSEDGTATTVKRISDNDSRFSVLQGIATGKKQAITQGIDAAKGTIIVTTDADCRVTRHWISQMTRDFSDRQTQFVFGGVTMHGETFFSSLQSMEFATLVATGAATAEMGIPTMCNGANLAFRKTAFYAVGGYTGNMNIPSGDDGFLMRKIIDRFPNAAKFVAYRSSGVRTKANDDLKQLFHQRIRWAGKWRVQSSLTAKVLAIFIFSFHVSFVLLFPLTFLGVISPFLAAIMWLTKLVGELIFMRLAVQFLEVKWSWKAFGVLQFVYSLYVILIALFCNLRGFVWKGRKLKTLSVSGN
ncbi:MAG: glycosyltransferase [Chryseolinea sp.]